MNKIKCILGVDPGISGAVAFYFPELNKVSCYDMPIVAKQVDGAFLTRLIKNYSPDAASIEAVHSFSGQGVASTFRFGVSFGVVLGVVSANFIPIHLASPQRWKKHFRLTADKDESRALAIRLWPENQGFSRKKDNGRAEAALLARFYVETVK